MGWKPIAALAASILSLACSGSIAQATLITGFSSSGVQTTVVSVGDDVYIEAIARLGLTPNAPFVYDDLSWEGWTVRANGLTVYDGQGNSRSTGEPLGFAGSTQSLVIHPVIYSTPGTYLLHYDAFFLVHAAATNPNDPRLAACSAAHGGSCFQDIGFNYTESIALTVLPPTTAVPGPVAGAGLPGLLLAGGGLLAWLRMRKKALRRVAVC